MTRAEIVARARSAIGRPTRYVLGRGGRHPEAAHPADDQGRLDCSGYVAWVLGRDRHAPGQISGDWISTSSIYRDALGPRRLFAPSPTPEPGDLIVYPDYRQGERRRQGHVGVLVEAPPVCDAGWHQLARVIHCSSSASRRGDAIAETDASPWASRGVCVRYVG